MKGLVTISKVFKDGTIEQIAQDDNVLCTGMGETVVSVFSGDSSTKLEDILIGYCQIGVGRLDPVGADEYKKYVYKLDSPLTEVDYGSESTLDINIHDQVLPIGKQFDPSVDTIVLKQPFATLEDQSTTKLSNDTIHIRINIGTETANGKTISEFGLFSRNPEQKNRDQSILLAYKSFGADSGIAKTKDFTLAIDWQIKFLDGQEEGSISVQDSDGYNVVFIMCDDMGIDQLGIYDDQNPYEVSSASNPNRNAFNTSIYPHTPVLSSMASKGMVFRNARANTLCTPTRANLLTGRHAFNSKSVGVWGHGIATVSTSKNVDPAPGEAVEGNWTTSACRAGLGGLNNSFEFIDKNGDPTTLSQEIVSNAGEGWAGDETPLITEALDGHYKTAMVGKWHLAEFSSIQLYDDPTGPEGAEFGGGGYGLDKYGPGWSHLSSVGQWDHYRAFFHNLNKPPIPGYEDWNDAGWIDNTKWPYGNQNNAGYVNYFILGGTKSLTDVDGGGLSSMTFDGNPLGGSWTTFSQSMSGTVEDSTWPKNYEDRFPLLQGDASSHATHRTFSEASSLFNTMEEPFFMYVPLNAPHSPWTYPPSGNVNTKFYNDNNIQQLAFSGNGTAGGPAFSTSFQGESGQGGCASAVWVNQNASIEDMDTMLGQFLDNIDASRKNRTVFIFCGDNGSDKNALDYAYRYCWADPDQGGLGSPSGLGLLYTQILDPSSHYLPNRKGGQNGNQIDSSAHSGDGFKSSMYDRGVVVPFIASGPFIDPAHSYAFVDLVDIFPTVLDIASRNKALTPLEPNILAQYPSDGISILPLLRGSTDASGHDRQWSFIEVVRPFATDTGRPWYNGTWNQSYFKDFDTDCNGNGPNPLIPYSRNRGFTIRLSSEQLSQTVNLAPYGAQFTPNHDPPPNFGPIPEASSGIWKLIRPTVYDPEVCQNDNGTGGPDGQASKKWSNWDELYHLRDINFSAVNPIDGNMANRMIGVSALSSTLEMLDLIPQAAKNTAAPDPSPVQYLLDNCDPTDADDYYWQLARIYVTVHLALKYFLSHRIEPGSTGALLESTYGGYPAEAARLGIDLTQFNSTDN